MINTPATEVISAIVTPAILILSCSSLITATANRQSKLLERVRDLTTDVEKFQSAYEEKRRFLGSQLMKATLRARLVQRALLSLYLSLGSLVLTVVLMGVSSLNLVADSRFNDPRIIISAIFLSLLFLFYASFLLIRESRIALQAVNAEMDYVKRLVG